MRGMRRHERPRARLMVRSVPEHPEFRLAVEAGPDRIVVALSGELDVAHAAEFKAAVREQLAAGTVVLDLSELEFMDSSGVRALDALLDEADRAGRTLLIRRRLQDEVRQILDMTGMTGVLPFEDGGGSA